MSPPPHTRRCRRCDRELAARPHQGEAGLVLLWLCSCGCAYVRTVSHGAIRHEFIATAVALRLQTELADPPRKTRS